MMRQFGATMKGIILVGIAGVARAQGPAHSSAGDPSWQSYLAHIAAAEASLRLNESAEARRWLDSAPAEHRGWEWRHLNAIADESLETLATDPKGVESVAISPDGARVAFAAGSAVRLWDLKQRKEIARLEGHTDAIFCVRFSPDGRRLVTASYDKTARTWDGTTGQSLLSFTRHNFPVAAAAFSPDGKRIATSSYERPEAPAGVVGTVHLWDAAGGEIIKTFTGGEKPLTCLEFSPDGKQLAAGSWDSFVFQWDVEAGGEPRTFGQKRGKDSSFHIHTIAFSPDGALLGAGSGEDWVRVWKTADGEQVAELTAHGSAVRAVAFSPDGGTVATAGYDDCVRIWDARSWAQLDQLRGHRGAVRCLAWTPDGSRLLSGSADGTLRAWDPSFRGYGGIQIRHDPACYAAPFSSDGERLATCSYDGTLALWNANTGEPIARWTAHSDGPVCAVAFSPDGRRLVSCSWDKSARIFDAATQQELRVLQHEAGIARTEFSLDNVHLATALTNKTVQIWNAETGEAVHMLAGHEGRVNTATFSRDGKLVASASSDRTVRTWDAETGKPLAAMRGHESAVESCAVSPDGRAVVSGSGDGSVRLWNARSGELVRVLHDGDESVYRVAFSPDGSRVAAGTTRLLILDVARGGVVARLRPHADVIWSLEFSKDGTRLATCSWDGTIAILESVPLHERLKGRPN